MNQNNSVIFNIKFQFLKTFTKLHTAGSNLLWNAEQYFFFFKLPIVINKAVLIARFILTLAVLAFTDKRSQ